MTNEQADKIGKRAVAAPGWRWLRGVRLIPDKHARILAVDEDSVPVEICGAEEGATNDDNCALWFRPGEGAAVDLRDPATLGAVESLAIARLESAGYVMPHLALVQKSGRLFWVWHSVTNGRAMAVEVLGRAPFTVEKIYAETRAEAIVLALEVVL